MRIRDITATTLRFEYPPGSEFDFAGGRCNARLTTLIRVDTDEGVSGIGSVYSHPELVRLIVERQLRPLLIGHDALDIDTLWQRAYSVTRWYGRKGVAVSTLGGIDTALWDIRGKAAQKPICQLLGEPRPRVPAYASGLLWKPDPALLAEEAQRHLARGFRAMKMRLARSYAYDSAALRVVRDAIGPANRLMIDGNARYPFDQAVRLAPEFQAAGVFWLEEPFLPENPDDFRRLRPYLNGIPLAAGENEFGLQGFRELIDGNVVDIVQPDVCRCGGITESLRVAKLAADHHLRMAPHTWSDAIALVANMHVVASQPHALTVEMDQTGNPFIEDLLTEPLRVVDGDLLVPTRSGLGIELNEDTVAKYRLAPGELPDSNYSDMVFGASYYNPAGAYQS